MSANRRYSTGSPAVATPWWPTSRPDRDRHYGHGRGASKPYLVVDTGGFEPIVTDGIMHEMARQTLQAVDEADAVIFGGRPLGATPHDKIIANQLRQLGRPVYLVVNKAEACAATWPAPSSRAGAGRAVGDFGAHGDGVRELIEDDARALPRRQRGRTPASIPNSP